jgi:hypothetical protein
MSMSWERGIVFCASGVASSGSIAIDVTKSRRENT